MRDSLLAFLKHLEMTLPPPEGCHHAITFAQFGNDQDGWEDKLALQINHGGGFKCWFLEDGDMEKGPADLVAEIVALGYTAQ